MSKAGGSLDRGRRRADEVPDVPDPDSLRVVQRAAQAELLRLVDRAGGRFGSNPPIPVERLDVLAELFDDWASVHGVRRGQTLHFSGRPGLWHALDELCPLQDPNRWDALRLRVIERLESMHWRRIAPPRGSTFEISLESHGSTPAPDAMRHNALERVRLTTGGEAKRDAGREHSYRTVSGKRFHLRTRARDVQTGGAIRYWFGIQDRFWRPGEHFVLACDLDFVLVVPAIVWLPHMDRFSISRLGTDSQSRQPHIYWDGPAYELREGTRDTQPLVMDLSPYVDAFDLLK